MSRLINSITVQTGVSQTCVCRFLKTLYLIGPEVSNHGIIAL
jgi:hypothetical protein